MVLWLSFCSHSLVFLHFPFVFFPYALCVLEVFILLAFSGVWGIHFARWGGGGVIGVRTLRIDNEGYILAEPKIICARRALPKGATSALKRFKTFITRFEIFQNATRRLRPPKKHFRTLQNTTNRFKTLQTLQNASSASKRQHLRVQ